MSCCIVLLLDLFLSVKIELLFPLIIQYTYMFVLTLKGGIGFTETIFVFKIVVMLVILNHPGHHGIVGILQVAVLFGLPTYHGIIHIPDRRLFRFAVVSKHHLISLIAVYFGLSRYHGICPISSSVT